MELLKLDLENLNITPTLSNIDEEIYVEFQIESSYIHDLILKINVKVNKNNKLKINKKAYFRCGSKKHRNIFAERKHAYKKRLKQYTIQNHKYEFNKQKSIQR